MIEPSRMRRIWWRFKCFFGMGSVYDGSICWVAQRVPHWRDPHDYHVHKGGDGSPWHFYIYTCHQCGREFSI